MTQDSTCGPTHHNACAHREAYFAGLEARVRELELDLAAKPYMTPGERRYLHKAGFLLVVVLVFALVRWLGWIGD